MVSLPVPGIATPHVLAPRRGAGETWLVLSADGRRAMDAAPADAVRLVLLADPDLLLRSLVELRPRIVVVAEPPADRTLVDAVAWHRRLNPWMRAVHLTAPGAVDRRLASLQAGFDDALSIAIPSQELAGRLSWLAGRSDGLRPPASLLPVTDELVLDLEAHALRRDGVAVHLRPKEYALLALLASHPGRAFSREELLRIVWGPDHAADSRTVDVHVRWVRAKIEPDPDHATHLVTVRGTGYRFDPPG